VNKLEVIEKSPYKDNQIVPSQNLLFEIWTASKGPFVSLLLG
jgi:hypothetical protein